MLIMQKWDFSGTSDLLKMLLNTLYFHYMRYRTDTMTQTWEKWLRSRFLAILSLKSQKVLFFNFLKKNFGPAVFCKCFYPFYTCIICGIGQIQWLKLDKSGLEFEKFRFLTFFEKILSLRWPDLTMEKNFFFAVFNSKRKKSKKIEKTKKKILTPKNPKILT